MLLLMESPAARLNACPQPCVIESIDSSRRICVATSFRGPVMLIALSQHWPQQLIIGGFILDSTSFEIATNISPLIDSAKQSLKILHVVQTICQYQGNKLLCSLLEIPVTSSAISYGPRYINSNDLNYLIVNLRTSELDQFLICPSTGTEETKIIGSNQSGCQAIFMYPHNYYTSFTITQQVEICLTCRICLSLGQQNIVL